MDPITLSRWQFGLTTVYQFLFVPLTLGLGWFVAYMQTRYYQTRDESWRKMSKFWGKLFLINFAIGVVTGIVQESAIASRVIRRRAPAPRARLVRCATVIVRSVDSSASTRRARFRKTVMSRWSSAVTPLLRTCISRRSRRASSSSVCATCRAVRSPASTARSSRRSAGR